jgi:type I restriction enzyme S subunit
MKDKIRISDLISAGGVFTDGDWVESKDQDPNGEVRLIQLADIGDGKFHNKSNRFLTENNAKRLRCTFLEEGDILIARMPEPIGRACILPELKTKAVTVVDVCVIRPNSNDVYVPYLKFLINDNSFRNEILKHVTGTTRKRISRSNLNKIKFQLPPLNNQSRIAKVLSDCEALIQKRKDSISLLDELLKSTFLEMFGDPSINPKDFPIKKLSEFYVNPKEGTKCGPFGSALKKGEYKLAGIPVWNMDNISNDGRFVKGNRLWIEEKKFEQLSGFATESGDIIISRAGTVGKMCVLKTKQPKSIISTNLIRLRLNSETLLPIYFVSLMTFFKGRVGRLKTGADGGFTHMNTTVLDKLLFPYPSPKLQLEYSNIVDKTEEIRQQFQVSLKELENLYRCISQKAFSGELDLSKIEITDMEEKEPTKPETEPVGEPYQVGKATLQDNKVNIDKIIKNNFADVSFTFQQLDEAIQNTGVYVKYDAIKDFVFKSLEGEDSFLEQLFDDKKREMKLKIRV